MIYKDYQFGVKLKMENKQYFGILKTNMKFNNNYNKNNNVMD